LLSIDALLKLGQRAEQPTKEDAHGPETQGESQQNAQNAQANLILARTCPQS